MDTYNPDHLGSMGCDSQNTRAERLTIKDHAVEIGMGPHSITVLLGRCSRK